MENNDNIIKSGRFTEKGVVASAICFCISWDHFVRHIETRRNSIYSDTGLLNYVNCHLHHNGLCELENYKFKRASSIFFFNERLIRAAKNLKTTNIERHEIDVQLKSCITDDINL